MLDGAQRAPQRDVDPGVDGKRESGFIKSATRCRCPLLGRPFGRSGLTVGAIELTVVLGAEPHGHHRTGRVLNDDVGGGAEPARADGNRRHHVREPVGNHQPDDPGLDPNAVSATHNAAASSSQFAAASPVTRRSRRRSPRDVFSRHGRQYRTPTTKRANANFIGNSFAPRSRLTMLDSLGFRRHSVSIHDAGPHHHHTTRTAMTTSFPDHNPDRGSRTSHVEHSCDDQPCSAWLRPRCRRSRPAVARDRQPPKRTFRPRTAVRPHRTCRHQRTRSQPAGRRQPVV